MWWLTMAVKEHKNEVEATQMCMRRFGTCMDVANFDGGCCYVVLNCNLQSKALGVGHSNKEGSREALGMYHSKGLIRWKTQASFLTLNIALH
jgi:hypothetical protein